MLTHEIFLSTIKVSALECSIGCFFMDEYKVHMIAVSNRAKFTRPLITLIKTKISKNFAF